MKAHGLRAAIVVVGSLLIGSTLRAQSTGEATPDPLPAIRALYASAAYEEALARASEHVEGPNAQAIAVYRALCLLALGRTSEVEDTLEKLVTASPSYTLDENDVSPKLVDMFRQVRRRALPNIARTLYTKAKSDFEAKRFADADAQLTQMLSLLTDEEMKEQPALEDLKMLGTGFRDLARAQLAAATPPPAPTTPAPGAAASTPAPAAPASAEPAVYSAADTGITAPVALARTLPPWQPLGDRTRRSFVAILEIVVNESGTVESAVIRQPVTPAYDASLLKAAKAWRFSPATKEGRPVKYRTFVRVVLQGS